MDYSLIGAQSRTHLKIVAMAFISSAIVAMIIYSSQDANSAWTPRLAVEMSTASASASASSVCRYREL